MQQLTIKKPIIINGLSLHGGKNITMHLKPLTANEGIIFKRVDLPDNNIISAKYYNVNFTTLCTKIDNGLGASVATIEHLMAALFALGIDNLLIEINGEEVPVLDGSAAIFIKEIKKAGVTALNESKKFLQILKPVEYKNDHSYIKIEPCDNFIVKATIDFPDTLIDKQEYKYINGVTNFEKEIAKARTFGFFKDVEVLRKMGLGLGANINNTVVISENPQKLLGDTKLRYKNEFVKHKVLDLCGDLYLGGYFIKGKVTAFKPGHNSNNLILRNIFSNSDNYKIIDSIPEDIALQFKNIPSLHTVSY